MGFITNENEKITGITEIPIEKIDYAVGRILCESIIDKNTGTCLFRAPNTPLTREQVELIKKGWTKNPDIFPEILALQSIIKNTKPESFGKKERSETTSLLSSIKKDFKMHLYRNDLEKEIEKISVGAKKVVSDIKFLGSNGSVSYNYLDYGMVKPDSYERAANALLFIVSLGKAYNEKNPADKVIDLKKLAEVSLLSTIGDIYSPENMGSSNHNKIDTKIDLARLCAKVYESATFKIRVPKFDAKMLDEYNRNYIALYSYLMLKGKENYSELESAGLDVILKTNENIDGSGPLGIKLKVDGNNAVKLDVMAQIIKIGFLWQDKLIELRENSNKEHTKDSISNVTDFYQTLRQLAKNNVIDAALLELMIATNPIYQNGDLVLLSDGKLASVIRQNSNFPEQPLVGYKNESGQLIPVDLSKVLNVTIKNGFATHELEFMIMESQNKKNIANNIPEEEQSAIKR